MDNGIYNGDSLATRTVSGFPLSIGTGLALEALFQPTQEVYDPQRVAPYQIVASQFQECWINLSTLFRNMVGSIQSETFAKTTELAFKEAILDEIEVIESLFLNEGLGVCRPVFYTMKYDKLEKSLPPTIKLRKDTTKNQIYFTQKHDRVMKMLTSDNDRIFEFDTEMRPVNHTKALIVTHVPYDLLSYNRFSDLTLLESHTGNVKGRNQWYSKYYPVGERSLSHIPFMRKLLLLFGDRVLIAPGIYKLREQIIEIAKKRDWTQSTTEARVIQSLELEIKEPFVLQFIKTL